MINKIIKVIGLGFIIYGLFSIITFSYKKSKYGYDKLKKTSSFDGYELIEGYINRKGEKCYFTQDDMGREIIHLTFLVSSDFVLRDLKIQESIDIEKQDFTFYSQILFDTEKYFLVNIVGSNDEIASPVNIFLNSANDIFIHEMIDNKPIKFTCENKVLGFGNNLNQKATIFYKGKMDVEMYTEDQFLIILIKL